MVGLSLMRKDEVVVTIVQTWVLLLVGFWWQRLKAENGSDVFFSLRDSKVMPEPCQQLVEPWD